MILNREELAWAAGFFDGEGSTSICACRLRDGTRTTALRLSISQKHPEVLHRFRAAVGGLGKVYETSHPRTPFCYSSGRFEATQAVLAMIWPFLDSVKRRQARRALELYWTSPRQSPVKRVEVARALGLRHRGRLSVDEVTTILDLLAHGATQRTVAECFGVPQPHISRIKTGHRYAHLASAWSVNP